ncbi:RebB family R body protein [Agrobacterium vitis]|uniref:RebB family R body protein n=1 Tax=Agrobacterium vitis TaxID=373 RepID=UPI001573FBA8|nr:RebB family R body protein [Agrobacterium vitis]NSZ19249.1 antirepresssor protein RebB [Agrobacterium vitis]QZO06122.1 RebB family R body protein [Agrobacterium vitis]UJL90445.1 RebB family R body protein [Agrobacterium vitis]
MTVPTTVNPVITDAVTQANVKVVGEAPAMAMGSLYQTASHSLGMMLENAVTAQQNLNILAQAATAQGVMQIYSIDTISDAIAVARMLQTTKSE